jgi:hypothetical protein
MIKDDWEKEADWDMIYAQERATLMEQEYFGTKNLKILPAKITYKKNENRSNTKSLRRNHEKGTQSRHVVSTKDDRRKV